MKLFFIISLLLSVAVAHQPSLSCSYFCTGSTYGCYLTIDNPNGFNNFTEIGGIHLDEFTNADVIYLYRSVGVSTNVASIICDTFPNLVTIGLDNFGLTEIDDSTFGVCSRITGLDLRGNRINSISTNAFANLADISFIDLESNLLTTLPENVFASQRNLTFLRISSNPFEDIPVGLFRPLENLQVLVLGNTSLSAINNEWFTTNARLYELHLHSNRIALSADSFVGLEGLRFLNLADNVINEIPVGTFARLPNLQTLYLYGNILTELNADSFPDLGHLVSLDISGNQIDVIHNGAFRGLENLYTLIMSSCGIRQLHATSFVDLRNLTNINLNFNELEELPDGVFVSLPNVYFIGLSNNRLKTLRRNSFGSLTSLQILNLDDNVVNALDRAIIDDAVNLNTLYFFSNLCANTITEHDDAFSFFKGPHHVMNSKKYQ